MLQKTYSIYSEDLNDVRLFVETGKNHIACWCKKKGDDKLRAFEFFQCDDHSAENFEELIDNIKLYSRLLTMPVGGTNFIWNTEEVLCVPKEKNDPSFLGQTFELISGNSPQATIFSAPTAHCLVAWRVNSIQQHIAEQCFPGAVFSHQYIPLLHSLKQDNESAAYLFFYPYYFTLALFKLSKLQFLQTTKYSNPEDVLYFVLNACKQYGLDNNIDIFCGGFIEEKSKLHDTLYQYLEGLQLVKADETLFAAEEFKEYAVHYFMPYINYVV